MTQALVPADPRPVLPDNAGRDGHVYDDERLVAMWLHGKSDNTREAYRRDIERFVAFADLPLQSVRLVHILDWADDLARRGLARASRARKLAAVKSLFTFGHKIGYLSFNVGAAVTTPKVTDRLSERILAEEDVRRVLELETDPRNSVLLRLFYASGGRVSELVGLTWEFVTERTLADGTTCGQVTVIGKGDRARSILLSADTWRALLGLHAREEAEGFGAPGDAVFRSRTGGALSRQQMWRIVKQAARRAGLKKPVSPHWFRHAHASHALDHGAPIHLVKETLGHKSLATTSKYTHARPDESSSNYLSV